MDVLARKVIREEELARDKKMDLMLSLFKSQQEQMKEMKKLMYKQAETIQELSTGVMANSHNTSNSHNTTNSHNNIVQNITINSYREPKTDGLVLSTMDIDTHAKIAYALIEKIYFNPELPENHSIYLLNKKDKTLMVYKGSDLDKSERWRMLTSEKDRQMLIVEIQNIIQQKGAKIVNDLYEDDEDKFIKLPKDLAERIISYNSGEREARVDEKQLLEFALKHKNMVEDTKKI